MLLLNGRESLATAATMMIQILVVGTLVFAGGNYLQWSSETNLAEFMGAPQMTGSPSTPAMTFNRQVHCDLKRSDDGSAGSAVALGWRPHAASPDQASSFASSANVLEDLSH
ncbi:hypothetical protein [Bradyrhizobium sp. USDA 3315]